MKPVSEKTKGYRRLIPSVTALVEFEAVARLRKASRSRPMS